jgi:hypothetical protein
MLVVVVVASILFFGWGWHRPPLDRVWQIQLELLLGTRQALASDERRLIQDTLTRYPLLAANMLEDEASGLISAHVGGMVDMDYAYVVRQTADAPGVLTITSPSGMPLKLIVGTLTTQTTGVANNAAPFVWTLPNTGPFPQLIEVRLIAEKPAAGTESLAIRGTDATANSAPIRRIRPMLVEVGAALPVSR